MLQLRFARRRAARAFSSAAAAPAAPSPSAPAPPLVTFARAATDARVGVLTLNNAPALNALSLAVADALDAAVAEALGARGLRAVVITGAGRAFSAGGDMAFLRARAAAGRAGDTAGNVAAMRNFYARFLRPLRETLALPTVAAINGAAVGAGLCLALAADMRIASRKAKLGVAFTNLGLHPGMGSTHRLPALVGPQFASRMLLTAELISGEEAARAGLVLEAADEADVLPRAVALAGRVAAQGPLAVRETVLSLRRGQDAGLESALQREAEAQASCYATKDFAEGIEAVMAKREPVWAEQA